MLLALGQVSARTNSRQQIHHEREDVPREHKGNDPLENRADVLLRPVVALCADAEADGKADLDDDEGEFDEEACEQDAVLGAVEEAQAEVLGADEDGADDVADAVGGEC
jgi:hypothetical protein